MCKFLCSHGHAEIIRALASQEQAAQATPEREKRTAAGQRCTPAEVGSKQGARDEKPRQSDPQDQQDFA